MQVVGAALTVVGLGETWWKWADSNAGTKYRILRLLGRAPSRKVHGVTKLVGTAWVVAEGDVKRTPPRPGIDGRVDALQMELDDFKSEARTRLRQSDVRMGEVEKSVRDVREELTDALQRQQDHLTQQTAQVAVDGIGLAAGGAFLALVGLLVEQLG